MSTPYGPPYGPPRQPQPYPSHPAVPPLPQRARRWPLVVISITAAVVMVVGIAVAAIGLGSVRPTAAGTASAPSSTAVATRPTTLPPPPLTLPDVQGMTREEAVVALTAAGFKIITFEQNGAPTSAKVQTQFPAPGGQHTGATAIHLVAELPPPGPHRAVSGRDWLLIAKSPDLHIGDRITVYGHVTQFDAVTGSTSFRASIDGVQHRRTYEYDTNTILRGTADQLANVVQGDVFRADVTVGGSYSYTTTMGGTLTVPILGVDAITVIG